MLTLVAVLAVLPPLGGRAQPLSHSRPDPPPVHWQTAVASWYYDEGATACGVHYPDGVANRTMPCGARVRLCFERCVTARVQDRGPFVEGREFDLSPETRDAIGCTDLCGQEGGTFRWAPR